MSDQLKHTPGPWEIEEDRFSDGFNILHNDRLPGKTYVAKEICQGYDNGEADAKLIAAAPDLLKACKALIDAPHYEHFAVRLNDHEMAALEQIKAAIEKATK